ncbi:MAG TPA: serine hydroxymethyltransferase [Candidatus Saccharimonadales bacterium]|nr:serine hydroxymethyltransferase [Candidatus Saccharimonadales bacterium]
MKLKNSDPKLFTLLKAEEKRQHEGLELIPSENYVSRAVLDALGTVFTNKYSEGYPGKRYYGGQVNTDQIENIAIERAKQLFHCDHANVQPSTGAPANLAAYFAWMEPGDTILGMDLSHGGHLTHGDPRTVAAKIFKFITYKIKDIETGALDYDQMRELAKQHKPKIILAGFSAYPRELDYAKISEIAKEVGAVAMADVAHIAGLIAGKQLKNPFDYGFQIVTTTTHKTLRGPRGGMILSKGIVSNPLRPVEKTIENLPTLIDRTVFPGMQGGPIMNSVFAKAVAFGEAQKPEFQEYAKQILKNAKRLADQLMSKGFKLVTNGTDNHLLLVDVMSSFNVSGKIAEETLDKIHLTLNKNMIPDDSRKPFDPSGIRLGTPAITSRGMKEKDMDVVAEWMYKAIMHHSDEKYLKNLATEVRAYCREFPLPSDL